MSKRPKTNGRRRWRKWSKQSRCSYRRRARRDGFVLHPQETRFHKGVHLKERKVCGLLPPLLSPPWSPRSLVGATMGARKRAARVAAYKACVWLDAPKETPPALARSVVAYKGSADERSKAWYLKEIAKYRIGERLRLCLVCKWAKCKLPCKDCSTCDGSGVVPARKAVRS